MIDLNTTVPQKVKGWEFWKVMQDWNKNRKESSRVNIYYKSKRTFVAMDNTTGDCWIEEFSTEQKALDWLNRRKDGDR